jgi:lipid-binding SYLF domain-containing protein
MKKVLIVLCMAALCIPLVAASDKAALDQRVESSKNVIDEIMQTPDKSIPASVMQKATCIAVVPSFKKGAFIVGAQYGQGVVTCRTAQGWSGPVFIRMEGGSFGLQAGGQGTDLVLVAVNQRGMQDLLKSKFKIGGDAAAAAGPVGRNAQASTDWKLNAELLTYSRSKGLLAGIDLDGTSVSQNNADTSTYYGSTHSTKEILNGTVPPPPSAEAFVRAVETYSRQS